MGSILMRKDIVPTFQDPHRQMKIQNRLPSSPVTEICDFKGLPTLLPQYLFIYLLMPEDVFK